MNENRRSLKRILLMTLILLAPALVGVAITTGQDEDARAKRAQDKWEYLVVAGASTTNFTPTGNSQMRKDGVGTFGREGFVLEQHLDKLGANGWELVSVSGIPQDPVYYLKRRK